ncbi:MAG: ABC transporter ATP-binding protein [Desulfovibrionaceae bacterium]
MAAPAPLVRLEHVSVTYAGQPAIRDVSWRLMPGEHWAVLGENGAGKSTFLRVVRGEQWPDASSAPEGLRLFGLDGKEQASPIGMRHRMATVSAGQQDIYMQQGWDMDGLTAVLTGYCDTPFLYQPVSEAQRQHAETIMDALGIAPLRAMRLPAMSQGQLRRILIARALVGGPAVLLLDEVCDGLDAASRQAVQATVDTVAAGGTTILFAAHRPEQLPAAITHVAVFQAGRLALQGRRDDATVQDALQRLFSDAHAAQRALACPLPIRREPGTDAPPPAIIVTNADVFIDRTQVLFGVNWRVEPGQHWVVLGENGSGKSTLCKLVLGEHVAAWGGGVQRFGLGEPPEYATDMEAVHRRIGYVSPDQQALYGYESGYDLRAEELVWSGFAGTVGVYGAPDAAQRAMALRWMEAVGVDHLARRRIRSLSTGQLRRCFLARAMVGGPDLLILDEPCSGLDARSRALFLRLAGRMATAGTQVVLVTHYQSEIIPEITHALVMAQGRVRACGPVAEVLGAARPAGA